MTIDWDDAYANSAYIPESEEIMAGWARDSAAFRAEARGHLDLAYGTGPRSLYDLFLPEGLPRGLFVFIHGGYWMRFDKSTWSHLAAGAVGLGWAAAIPSYQLCPTVRITSITARIGIAIADAAERIKGPIVVSGHSAGGHLAARMVCRGAPVQLAVRRRIAHVFGISGIYDLRPLMRTKMNETLHLSDVEAAAESPALLACAEGTAVTCWVGADERPEFRRQSALLANVWTGLGARTAYIEAPGRHHFDVIAPLADPGSAMMHAVLAGPEERTTPAQAPRPA